MTRRRPSHRGGFTLVEVLATLVLLGVVLPVAMRGVSLAISSADVARHTAEAASLAEAKLNELVITGDWSVSGASGDFGAEWPDYRWTCQSAGRDYGLTEVMLSVVWTDKGRERDVTVSTLVYDTGTTSGTSTGTGVTP